jgi:hypothetical protein
MPIASTLRLSLVFLCSAQLALPISAAYVIKKDGVGFYESHAVKSKQQKSKTCSDARFAPPFPAKASIQGCCILEHSDVLALYISSLDYCVKEVEKKVRVHVVLPHVSKLPVFIGNAPRV